MQKSELPEPWLRGTLAEVPAVQRAVLHALELAKEDLERWCDGLSDEELHARPGGIAPVAFHLRHIARSMDRLLTYAEGNQLSAGADFDHEGRDGPVRQQKRVAGRACGGDCQERQTHPLFLARTVGRRARSVGKEAAPHIRRQDCWSTWLTTRSGTSVRPSQRQRSWWRSEE